MNMLMSLALNTNSEENISKIKTDKINTSYFIINDKFKIYVIHLD